MKLEIRDLCKPKDKNDARFFQVLLTVSIVRQNGLWHVYLALFNICVVIRFY
jgi:hypothetical protein